MKRARPRKTRKLKALGLSDRPGLLKPVAENLPNDQEDEELAVASKFLGALWHLYAIDLFDPQRGKEPADVMCRRRGGTSVELQTGTCRSGQHFDRSHRERPGGGDRCGHRREDTPEVK